MSYLLITIYDYTTIIVYIYYDNIIKKNEYIIKK